VAEFLVGLVMLGTVAIVGGIVWLFMSKEERQRMMDLAVDTVAGE
jgi:hypothetical protein